MAKVDETKIEIPESDILTITNKGNGNINIASDATGLETDFTVKKDLQTRVSDGAKYIGFAQPIGGLLAYLLLRGTGATVEDVITVAAGMTALTNIALIVFNYYFKIF